MINFSELLKKCDQLKNADIDKILFEGAYPVLFTMADSEKEYLVICPVVNSKEMTWIVSETSFSNIIELLTNKITIRDAFLAVSDDKICLTYDGKKMETTIEKRQTFPEELLPDAGEFIDAEDDEFEEEIEYYRKREQYRSISISAIRWQIYLLQNNKHVISRNKQEWERNTDNAGKQTSFFNIPIPDKSYSTIGG